MFAFFFLSVYNDKKPVIAFKGYSFMGFLFYYLTLKENYIGLSHTITNTNFSVCRRKK